MLSKRSSCVVRGTDDLEHLFTLPSMPVSMYCVDTPAGDDVFADMVWCISSGAGCVQLGELVPLPLLYKHEHGSGAVGRTWQAHHQEFCEFLASHSVCRPLEIGAGHGALARQFLETHKNATWVIVEPNLPSWTHDRVTMVGTMFGASFDLPQNIEPIDAIVHSHTFEHMYDPRDFLQTVSRFLNVGQKHVFSLPRLDVWLRHEYSNALNFEHTVLLTEALIDELLQLTGFSILEKRYFGADHSVFYATEKTSDPVFNDLSSYRVSEYAQNRKLFCDYIKAQQDAVARMNGQLQNADGDVFLFGAHVFSQFLIGFGLDIKRVVGILDNDSAKHGLRLYGTSLTVMGTGALKDAHRPLVVLRAGAYRNEIVQSILRVRPDARFIE